MIKVEPYWELSEIIILLKGGDKFILNDHLNEEPRLNRFGYSDNGSISLTLEKAKDLVLQLHCAIERYERIERSVKERDEYQRDKIREAEIAAFVNSKYKSIAVDNQLNGVSDEEYNKARKIVYIDKEHRLGDMALNYSDIGTLAIESDTHDVYKIVMVEASKYVKTPKKIRVKWEYLGKYYEYVNLEL